MGLVNNSVSLTLTRHANAAMLALAEKTNNKKILRSYITCHLVHDHFYSKIVPALITISSRKKPKKEEVFSSIFYWPCEIIGEMDSRISADLMNGIVHRAAEEYEEFLAVRKKVSNSTGLGKQ